MGHGPGRALDIGGQGRVIFDVIGGMLADDIDDAGFRLLGVVQIGQAVGQTGGQMQQGGGRLAQHAVIAVRSAGDHALEQPQHAAHAGHLVQGGDEMHLGGAGVGEADVDVTSDQGAHKAFGAIHFVTHQITTPIK